MVWCGFTKLVVIMVRRTGYKMQERTVYSVFNEVTKSLYPALAGAITDVKRFLMTGGNPDPDLISYYSKINQAH